MLPVGRRPVYSVFVALYREAAVVPQLVATLDRLERPAACLDIKLIGEADDQETSMRWQPPRSARKEVIRVPPAQPRTKPKALDLARSAQPGANTW